MRETRSKLVVTVLLAVGFIMVLGITAAFAADNAYVGVMKCKGCHKKQFKSFSETKHAKAFDLLSADEQKDAKCLGCHTTGYDKPAKANAKLTGVQCEACHGAGSKYKSMKVMSKKLYKSDKAGQHEKAVAAGLIVPDEAVCKSCHNSNSPNFKSFNFAEAVEKIKH